MLMSLGLGLGIAMQDNPNWVDAYRVGDVAAGLILDFPKNRYFNGTQKTIDELMTSARADTKSAWDANGDITTIAAETPVTLYDPVTLARLGVIGEPTISRINLWPECKDDGTKWIDRGSASTNLSLAALGVFDGVSVASTGGASDILYHPSSVSLTNASAYYITFIYRAGTSGAAYIRLWDTTKGTLTELSGVVGSLAVTNSAAGAISKLTETLLSDGITYLVTMLLTKTITGDVWICLGPNSTSAGETIIALAGLVGGAGESLPACPILGNAGSTETTDADELTLFPKPSGVELFSAFDTLGAGWTDDGGGAYSSDGTQAGNSDASQASGLTVTRDITVTFTITNYSAGNATPLAGSSGTGTARSANGTFTETITVSGSGAIIVRADVNFIGSISAITYQELVPFVGFDGSEGTWVFEGRWAHASDAQRFILAGDLNTRFIYQDATVSHAIKTYDGSTVVNKNSVFTDNTNIKIAMSYLEGGKFNILADGSTEADFDLTGDLYAPKTDIGHLGGSNEALELIVERILWYPVQFSELVRQGLTS